MPTLVRLGLLGCLLALACGERVILAPLPDDQTLAAVVFLESEDRVISATPLTELNGSTPVRTRLPAGRDASAYLIGFRPETLRAVLPDDGSWQSMPLRQANRNESRLPRPDGVYLARPGSDSAQQVESYALPPLTADWLPPCAPDVVDRPLLVDTDCGYPSAPWLANPITLQCRGNVQVAGPTDTLTYDLGLERFVSLDSNDDLPCELRSLSGDALLSAECRLPCIVDVLRPRPHVDMEPSVVSLVDEEVLPPALPPMRPPLFGFLEGLIAAPDGQVLTIRRHENVVERRCGQGVREWIRLGLAPGSPESIAVLETQPAPACATLMQPSPAGPSEFFALFRDSDRRWRWGRFDSGGAVVTSTVVDSGVVGRLTPTAAAWIQDRWVIAMSDLRSEASRTDREDPREGLRPHLVTISQGAERALVGPVAAERAPPGAVVTSVFAGAGGTVLMGQNGDLLIRSDLFTLEPTRTDAAYSVSAFGPNSVPGSIQAAPHLGLRIQSDPEELVLLSFSDSRYRPEKIEVEAGAAVHLVRSRVPVADRMWFEGHAEVTALAPWPGRPRSLLMGAFLHHQGPRTWPPNWPAFLARFDLDRPGFVPGRLDVGDSPITALLVLDDGQVWGLQGFTGRVFHTQLPE